MRSLFQRVPSWFWGLLIQAVILIYALGKASEAYASKAYVDEHIKEAQALSRSDVQELKALIIKLDDRLYQEATKKAGR